MQALRVLRGCIAAYVAGVLLVWGATMALAQLRPEQLAHYGDTWGAAARRILGITATYGALYAGLLAGIVLLLWFGSALLQASFSWWNAPLAGGVLAGAVTWSIFPFLPSMICATVFGALAGGIFWLAAFGTAGRMTMSLRRARTGQTA